MQISSKRSQHIIVTQNLIGKALLSGGGFMNSRRIPLVGL